MLKIPHVLGICRQVETFDDLDADEPFGEDCNYWVEDGICLRDKLPCKHTTVRIDWEGEHLD